MLAAPGKVHGSNFSFETDGGQVRYYSRYKEVARSEKFIRKTCVEDAMGKYDAAVRRAFRLHSEAGARPIRSLRIYGEYFGGWYPAAGVAARGAGAGQKVQAHAPAYAPEHDFFAFEVRADGEFLDFDDAVALLREARRGNIDPQRMPIDPHEAAHVA